MRIAIIGYGMVGGALGRYFESHDVPIAIYDPPKGYTDASVLAKTEIVIVAVPTPFHLDGRGFDDSFLRGAIETIPGSGKIVVLKSTILPGTTDRMQSLYPQHRILFNPEFLTEATADEDTHHPNRQIVGYTPQSHGDAERIMNLLPSAPFKTIVPANAAEMTKYFGNGFYALKVAFANQLFDLCERLGIDYDLVRQCAAAEPWIGGQHLQVVHHDYRGFGGKCLPKDTRALIHLGEQNGVMPSILAEAERYNNELLLSQGIDVRWKEGSPSNPLAAPGR
jgi:UDPglucose 6-dehydrogenase